MALQAVQSKNKVLPGKRQSKYRGQQIRLCSIESPSNHAESGNSKLIESIDRMERIIGWHDLIELLEPKHPYFSDKKARVKGFKRYVVEGRQHGYLYPELCGMYDRYMPKNNPMRKHQLAESHTARRITMIRELINKRGLNGFKMAFLTLTMPGEVSSWLAAQKSGKDMAWRLFQRFWGWYDDKFGYGLAASVNLHTWKSEKPIEPHYHFHCLIPNYRKAICEIVDPEGNETYQLVMQNWPKNKSGTSVPFMDEELRSVKDKWREIMIFFARRHKIAWNEGDIDLYVEFARWEEERGRILLLHWFNYQGRYSLEDYVKYSNKNPDCPYPPEWLKCYENHARAFGWWRDMKVMAGKINIKHEKIDILTGKPMVYMGHWTAKELLMRGTLGYLDIYKGLPTYHKLKNKEILWLIKHDKESRVDCYGIITLTRPVIKY